MPQIPIAAMIAASVIATSSTGGNVVGPGTVVRTGDAYASSNVTVVSSGQGSSTIEIRTNTNGHVVEERRDVSGQNGAHVQVSVTATSGPAQVEVRVTPPTASTTDSLSWVKRLFGWSPKPQVVSTTTVSASSSVDSGARAQASVNIVTRISTWFSSFFSFFK